MAEKSQKCMLNDGSGRKKKNDIIERLSETLLILKVRNAGLDKNLRIHQSMIIIIV